MSSFDYDISAEFNGGTIIINGSEVSEIPQSMMGGMHGNMNGAGNQSRADSECYGIYGWQLYKAAFFVYNYIIPNRRCVLWQGY